MNSDLWQMIEDGNEVTYQIVNNKVVDYIGGKVILFKELLHNYRMKAELCFLGHHLPEGNGGWFGFTFRAKDTDNYELVWFVPNAGDNKSVAYLSVAHGVVPWWSEAYSTQQRGKAEITCGKWFSAQVDVLDDEFIVQVKGNEIFRKKLTYYLEEGYPGLYIGTATDAAFKHVMIESLK